MKHLVCACTGMPRQDLEWLFEYKSATPKSALSLLGTMEPTSKFGEVFQYSNLMAAAAGFIGGHALDPEQGARRRLRRGDAQGDLRAARHEGDDVRLQGRAQGQPRDAARRRHRRASVAIAPMDVNYSIVALRPAGGAWSSVNDMLKYVQMELAAGKLPDGKTFISEAALMARREPQVMIGEDHTYGMGLMVNTS